MLREERRVTGKIAAEKAYQREAEEIGHRLSGNGSLDHREHSAVGGVDALSAVGPLPILRIALGKFGAFQNFPRIEIHAVDHTDLVAILEILANRQIQQYRNLPFTQMI